MQAAKRTPVDLQEWAISMMERHNRKSYLQPPAPKSLKESNTPSANTPSSSAAPTPAAVPKIAPVSKPTRTPQPQPSPYQQYPTSAEIPLNIANDVSSSSRYHGHGHQGHHYSSSRGTRSPPPPSLEHLSLETKDSDLRAGRRPTRHLGDPVSAVDAPSRPFMSPRSVSTNNNKSQSNLNSASLPIRAVPPPSGPPPPPPVTAGGHWRGYPGQMPGAT